MEPKDKWVFFREIDWDCPNNNVFSVDTRDFHCGYRFEKEPHADFDTIKKYKHFFHTKEELVSLLERYFTESGGVGEWRFFMLEGMDNWEMKYLRIWRTELGFVVCSQHDHALNKQFLALPVNKDIENVAH